MFDIGDKIVYGQNGICEVVDITNPDFLGTDKKILYYVLVPQKNPSGRLYCPVGNDKVMIRRVISAKEAKEIIAETKTIEPISITNDRMRDETYKKAMKSLDLRQCIMVLKTLLIRKQEREEAGKKVTSTDERYLKLAEEELFSELALAIGKEREEVRNMVLSNC